MKTEAEILRDITACEFSIPVGQSIILTIMDHTRLTPGKEQHRSGKPICQSLAIARREITTISSGPPQTPQKDTTLVSTTKQSTVAEYQRTTCYLVHHCRRATDSAQFPTINMCYITPSNSHAFNTIFVKRYFRDES